MSEKSAIKIVIAGASGFMGGLLLEALKADHSLIALGRSKSSVTSGPLPDGVEWRSCDLFSLLQTESAVQGAALGIYLVHSMLPRAKLTQSSFEDCDILLADNFARAAQKAGITRIIYLSGLIPEGSTLSRHLESRREVERVLSSRGAQLTTLRSGLILGARGSSFQMLYILVKRLPVMICPSWTRTRTQCIADSDVVELIQQCLEDPSTIGKTYDIGSPEIMSYQDLMKLLSQTMGKQRLFFSVPFFSPGLSRLWVQLITGGSRNLVSPLVESLRHEMVTRDEALLTLRGKAMMGIGEALRRALLGIQPSLRSATRERRRLLQGKPEVRSIQRFTLADPQPASGIADEYFRWMPRFLAPLILVRKDESDPETWLFSIPFLRFPLLRLWRCRARSSEDRQLFYIRGGLLVARNQSRNSRLEFRTVLDGHACLAAIHEFKPALPWLIYKYTQALVHLWVMNGFRKYLESSNYRRNQN
jgi:uncharacterized protein YbjT (DUF2867 family)